MRERGHGFRGWRPSGPWNGAPSSFALALLAALLIPAFAHAVKPGDLDRSFGDHGKVRACGGHGGHFVPIAIDAHNRIVSGGDCLSRTLQSGRPDRAFGYTGGGGHALAFDGGKIVTAGRNGHHGSFDIARYKANGSPDRSFHGAGFGYPNQSALSVAVDSHHRPVAAGYSQFATDTDVMLARFKRNGDLDPSFGDGGKVRTDFGTDSDYAASVGIDSGGRIVVGVGGDRFELARYQPDGTLDPSFGNDGKVTTDFGDRSRLNSIAIDAHNRIVAAGAAPRHEFALARYKPNGRLDRSFSHNGKVTGPLRGNFSGAGFVGIDSRRRIVAVAAGGVHNYKLARYKPNGGLDRSFGRNGVARIGGRTNVWSAAIDSRDRIVIGACNASAKLVRVIGYRKRS
ncbi:MAG: hypothetical protein ACRDMH_00735 [Solirubrobacterales bacterium]